MFEPSVAIRNPAEIDPPPALWVEEGPAGLLDDQGCGGLIPRLPTVIDEHVEPTLGALSVNLMRGSSSC